MMVFAIFRSPKLRATASAVALLTAACGGRRSSNLTPAEPAAPRIVPVSELFALEASGPPPPDTTDVLTAGVPRVIVLRHGPPENLVFAELSFPADAFGADSGRRVQVVVRPRPGIYGLDFQTDAPLVPNVAAITFKYPRFFSAPAAALARHGSNAAVEQVLQVGHVLGDSVVALLPSTRPASDNLQAKVPAAGGYIVMGPR